MSLSSLPSQVKAILALTSIAGCSVHIEGGWATGKSALATAVAKGHVESSAGDVWMVSESQEGDFHFASSFYRMGPEYMGRVRTLVQDEYADALVAWREGDLASPAPALVVLDDADRYSSPAHQPPVPAVWVSNPGTGPRQAPPDDLAKFALRRSRARKATIATMNRLGLPGVAELGSRTNIALRSPFYRRPTEALIAAINAWGIACAISPAQRGADDGEASIVREASRVVTHLAQTRVAATHDGLLHKVLAPRVALAISSQRSEGGGIDFPAGLPSDVVPCLLEDVATIRPDVVVVAAVDEDLEHLARLMSGSRYGSVVVTRAGSATHELFRSVDVPNWSLDR